MDGAGDVVVGGVVVGVGEHGNNPKVVGCKPLSRTSEGKAQRTACRSGWW